MKNLQVKQEIDFGPRTTNPLYTQCMMDIHRYITYHMGEIQQKILQPKIRLWIRLTPPGQLKRKLRGIAIYLTRRPLVKTVLLLTELLQITCEVQDIQSLECQKVIHANRFINMEDIVRSSIAWTDDQNLETARKPAIKQ